MKTSTPIDNDRAVTRSAGISRRNFLRGLGACVALPTFESLSSVKLFGATAVDKVGRTATGAPLRTAFVYFPNGAIPSAWWPEAPEGTQFQMSRTLRPLEPHRSQIQILGGLDDRSAMPEDDGAGDHARANGTFLTGVRLKKSATELHAGISIDQVIAKQIGQRTRFASLELTCETARMSGACDSGYSCAYQYNASWSSPTTPMTPEANPRLVFERLFGAGVPGLRAESLRRRRQEDRSILDFVMQDAQDMQRRLNAKDRDKLDQYLTGVRELESRIQKAERLGDPKDPQVEEPMGIPPTYGQHVQLMFEIMRLAFQTDSTRVATLLLAHDGSNRSFADIGVPEGHHDLSHHFGNADKIQKVSEIDLWYVGQFAMFLKRLEDTKDVDGRSLLYNSQIVYGSGNADGNRHSHTNLPIVLAGWGGGTLKPGRLVQHNSKPLTNLFLSMADRMGACNLDSFGDSSGRLADV